MVSQDTLLPLIKQTYATNINANPGTPEAELRDECGLFIIKNYPNDPALTDQRLFQYWQALGRGEVGQGQSKWHDGRQAAG